MPKYLYCWYAFVALSSLLILGYYHADEIGQITAFSLYQLGVEPAEALPWEFGARMRSWLVPGLYIPLLKLCNAVLGSYDYFVSERLMLVADALLWFLLLPVIGGLLRLPQRLATRDGYILPAIACCCCWWFLPSMLVRHSSEAIGTVFLLLYLYLQKPASEGEKEIPQTWYLSIIIGLIASFAFWARFQNAFFIAGFWICQAVTEIIDSRRVSLKSWLVALGVIIGLGVGIAIDSWGYGRFTVSFYNYFVQNITNDVASVFGEKSFFYYFYQLMGMTVNPLIIIWLPLAGYYGWKNRYLRNITIGLALFFVAHLLVPHKEIRFLMPMAFPIMILLLNLMDGRPWETLLGKWRYLFDHRYLKFIMWANFIMLVGVTLFGLTRDRVRAEAAIFALPHKDGQRVTVLTHTDIYGAEYPIETGHVERSNCEVPFKPYISQEYAAVDCKNLAGAWGKLFTKPDFVDLKFIQTEDAAGICKIEPEAYLFLTKKDADVSWDGIKIVDYPFENVEAAFPPTFTYRNNPFWVRMKWWQRMWRFKLVSCEEVIRTYTLLDSRKAL